MSHFGIVPTKHWNNIVVEFVISICGKKRYYCTAHCALKCKIFHHVDRDFKMKILELYGIHGSILHNTIIQVNRSHEHKKRNHL